MTTVLLPCVADMLAACPERSGFSTLYLKSGYYQVGLQQEDKEVNLIDGKRPVPIKNYVI